jgi:hypothetical protein
VAEKFLEGGDAAGRGADSDYQKVGFPASSAAGLPEAAVVSSLLIDGSARAHHQTNSRRIETPISPAIPVDECCPREAAILPPFARRRDFEQVALSQFASIR